MISTFQYELKSPVTIILEKRIMVDHRDFAETSQVYCDLITLYYKQYFETKLEQLKQTRVLEESTSHIKSSSVSNCLIEKMALNVE